MRRFLSFLIITFFLITLPTVYAATPTAEPTTTTTNKTTASTSPTSKPTPKVSEDPKNINILNELKDKIASKVAQLNLVQKKGTIGTITNISGTEVIIEDIHGDEVTLDTDELTKFSSPSAKSSFGISDLTKGSVVDVLGLYNKQSKHILARFIDVITLSRYIDGEVASVDKDNYLVNVISDAGTITPVDIENVTKTYVYTDGSLQKGGFSKIEQGKHIVVSGYTNTKELKHLLATRVIVFPQIAANPRIIIPQPALNPDTTVTPSTGSGKKLTPITK